MESGSDTPCAFLRSSGTCSTNRAPRRAGTGIPFIFAVFAHEVAARVVLVNVASVWFDVDEPTHFEAGHSSTNSPTLAWLMFCAYFAFSVEEGGGEEKHTSRVSFYTPCVILCGKRALCKRVLAGARRLAAWRCGCGRRIWMVGGLISR